MELDEHTTRALGVGDLWEEMAFTVGQNPLCAEGERERLKSIVYVGPRSFGVKRPSPQRLDLRK